MPNFILADDLNASGIGIVCSDATHKRRLLLDIVAVVTYQLSLLL